MLHAARFLVVLLITVTMTVGCRSGKLGPEESQKSQIRFGSGGGFTGAVHTYALLNSGRLYEHNSMGPDSFAFVLEVPKVKTKALFEEVKGMRLDTLSYHTYGNYYHFLEWRKGADFSRVTWSTDDSKAPEAWPKLLRRLKGLATPTE